MALLLAASLFASIAHAQPECASGLQLFIARGTGEDPGPGATGVLAEAVLDKIPGSAFEAIDYPASEEDPVYFDSVRNGTDAVREGLIGYTEACPDGKVAVLGYSQGAQVVANALSGVPIAWSPYPDSGENLAGLAENVTENIVGVVLFGDPSLAPNADYRKGTADVKREGLFHRHDTAGLEALGDRLVSYCDDGDVFCDAGSRPSAPAHLEYIENYGDEVLEFLVKRHEGSGSAPGDSPSDSPSEATRRAPSFKWRA